ncbi:MAG: rubrerythrin family protein [Methanomassiliicoccales archaeon]
MHAMTEQFMHNAYAGESMAHMRYLIYADAAEKEGFKNVARLFRAVAFAEEIHASGHMRRSPRKMGAVAAEAPFGVGKTAENLAVAVEGEKFEVEEMYPVYMETAKLQGEKIAYTSFEWAYKAEKVHKKMYEEAKELVDQGKDWRDAKVQICSTCGWTVEGEAPDVCPVCGAKSSAFRAF